MAIGNLYSHRNNDAIVRGQFKSLILLRRMTAS